ncbi:MAG: hypothetical protein ACYC3N_10755, partial [Halothiobacillus sp.]
NVLSEFMRPAPSLKVVAWLDAQASEQVWVCAISRAEIELGVALLPDGQRKLGLHMAAQAMFAEEFVGRCLSFDGQAAIHYAGIVVARTRLGHPISGHLKKSSRASSSARSRTVSDETYQIDRRGANEHATPQSDCAVGFSRCPSVEDAQIAAIALTHGLTLATRNERDFAWIDGLLVVNPWQAAT